MTLPVDTVYWIQSAIHNSLRDVLKQLVHYQANIVAVRMNVVPEDQDCLITIQVQIPEDHGLYSLGEPLNKNNRHYRELMLSGCRVVWETFPE